MERGDIFLVNLDPVVGSESNKQRPALIVSNNAANNSVERRGRGVVTVVPLTTNITNIYPFHVLLRPGDTGLEEASKAQAEQMRSVSTERFTRMVGRVSVARMRDLDDVLRLHLIL